MVYYLDGDPVFLDFIILIYRDHSSCIAQCFKTSIFLDFLWPMRASVSAGDKLKKNSVCVSFNNQTYLSILNNGFNIAYSRT